MASILSKPYVTRDKNIKRELNDVLTIRTSDVFQNLVAEVQGPLL